jgi:hypothetical protein
MAMQESETSVPVHELPALVIPLLKGVIYRESDASLWASLLALQARVRDHVAVMGLDLVLDEAEGYAFLRSQLQNDDEGQGEGVARMPRLIARRPLPFAVSLLLALLRKKLAEFDASGGDTRLVLTQGEIVEMVRVFLPQGSNEAKLVDQIETQINKVVELGFVRRLKPGSAQQAAAFEVRRILKAFVDAQWLADLDARLGAYHSQLASGAQAGTDG